MITLYTLNNCKPCETLKSVLKYLELDYQEIKIQELSDLEKDLIPIEVAPTMVIDSEVIKGVKKCTQVAVLSSVNTSVLFEASNGNYEYLLENG